MGAESLRKWGILRKIAAISSIVQGLTWLVLALICITEYYKQPIQYLDKGTLNKNSDFTELLSYCFYDTLFRYDNMHEPRALTSQNVNVVAWLYAVSSACWLGFAIWECIALFRTKTFRYEAHLLMALGIITILNCLLDVILMSLAFRDYFNMNVFDYDILFPTSTTPGNYEINTGLLTETEDEKLIAEGYVEVAYKYIIGRKIIYGILITLSARGFIIWIINCAFGIIFIYLSMQIFRAPPILKYDNRSIPRPKIASMPPQKDDGNLFGAVFADDNRHSSSPSRETRYSQPLGDWYDRPQSRSDTNNPLALNNGRNWRGQNMFN